ncbi:hypothetical protein K491DRAFT_685113 [Lophiostoma macrostomum CBS 122681]|uniref:Uncharacterized protein n=1 Tax=Lophiostoma macrostomum CBS 122681 TaxID=1314788 RepID=A0A6A6SJC9_9PLEO|nr:hypothetical protein K491DRAFT_685113 [Lophiostoma macrostomum CBS 122681]
MSDSFNRGRSRLRDIPLYERRRRPVTPGKGRPMGIANFVLGAVGLHRAADMYSKPLNSAYASQIPGRDAGIDQTLGQVFFKKSIERAEELVELSDDHESGQELSVIIIDIEHEGIQKNKYLAVIARKPSYPTEPLDLKFWEEEGDDKNYDENCDNDSKEEDEDEDASQPEPKRKPRYEDEVEALIALEKVVDKPWKNIMERKKHKDQLITRWIEVVEVARAKKSRVKGWTRERTYAYGFYS